MLNSNKILDNEEGNSNRITNKKKTTDRLNRTPKTEPLKYDNETITLTFGDVAENHTGMQRIGNRLSNGFSIEDLLSLKSYFDSIYEKDLSKRETKMIHLEDILERDEMEMDINPAAILVIPGGINEFVSADDLLEEQLGLEYDKKAYMK